MRVIYSIGAKFSAPGMGYTAYSAVNQLLRLNCLEKVVCFHHAPSQIPEGYICDVVPMAWGVAKFCHSLQAQGLPGYFIKDIIFDSLASKKISRCDILHCWSGHGLKSMICAKKMGMRVIIEQPCSHPGFQNDILKEEYKRLGVRGILAAKLSINRSIKEYDLADAILVPSSFSYDSFIRKGFDKNKLIVIPYGVDTQRFQPAPEKRERIFRCLFVGQVSLRKGIHYLLKAWDELKLKNSELIIAGPKFAEISSVLHFYQRSNKTIKWVSLVKEIEGLYQKSSLFILPSLEDGFGLVTTEAMSCGLPVIVSDQAGSKDMVQEGKSGFVVPAKDVEALKKKIMFFYEQPEAVLEMGQNARQEALKWSWSEYGQALINAYSIIKGEKP